MLRKTNVAEFVAVSRSEAARRCGLTNRAVTYYEERGLIEVGRDGRGRRMLNPQSVRRLEFIAMARYVGLSIGKIHHLLGIGDADGESVRNTAMISECRRRLAELDHDRTAIQDAMQSLAAETTQPRSRAQLTTASLP